MNAISPRGIVQQYVSGEELVVDGTALYVDNLIDCFESWNGDGSLHTWVIQQYEKEMVCLEALDFLTHPVMVAQRHVWRQLFQLARMETEEGLTAAYRSWKKDPKGTIVRLFCTLRQGEKRSENK